MGSKKQKNETTAETVVRRAREVLKFRRVVQRMAERRGLTLGVLVDAPQGPQDVVPSPQMTELRQLLNALQATVQHSNADVRDVVQRLDRDVGVVANAFATGSKWDSLTMLVFECVATADRATIVKLVPILHGRSLDAAAFVLADIQREQLDGKFDTDDWFRTRLQRATACMGKV